MAPPTTPVADRLMARVRVDASTGCWLWTGATYSSGYGHLKVGSATNGTKRTASAHRTSFETFVGPIPDGMQLDHLCSVRLCINPAHLEPVTPVENLRRAGHGTATHCRHGHEYTPENTHRSPKGWRQCRTCQRATQRRYRARKAVA